ncbi:MAG: hypothetical protein JXR96_19040 [Deltaproteobacteria bacterium]|nr:hypothetical protein [Deltaproteobacteria bacterium]
MIDQVMNEIVRHPYVVLGLAGLSLIMGTARVLRLSIMDIRPRPFVKQIQKLFLDTELERAIKLCETMPTAILACGTKHMLEVRNEGVRDDHALKEAFSRGVGKGGLSQAVGRGWEMSAVAFISLMLAGAAVHFRNFLPSQTEWAGLGAALMVALFGPWKAGRLRSKAENARDAIIETLKQRRV